MGLNQLTEWMKRQPEAQKVLESLGTNEEQQKIMCSQYKWAKDFIAGNPVQPTPTRMVPMPPPANTPLAKRPLESSPNGNSKRPRLI
ncbi:hypothetical protein PM082_019861 [Marasmius tenuissimus]|nr:hypothetical protein PM082_019861 [Marasmius tenuissimus]